VSAAADLWRLCRPRHWAKNSFVLAPAFFHGSIFVPSELAAALLATACFCLFSSAVYCWNDARDAEADRLHPRKRSRPVASGRVGVGRAVAFGALLAAAGSAVAAVLLPPSFLAWGGAYLANGLAYCLGLRRVVMVDALSIALGFVLRLVAGSAAIGVAPTSWLLQCGFALALLLALGKRRAELERVSDAGRSRESLDAYTKETLNTLLGVAAATCLVSYMLYTTSPVTVALHGTDGLTYTVPFVALGLFRYVLRAQQGAADGPVEILSEDPWFLGNAVAWMIAVLAIIHLS
jgi:4-hydroxybenzoate polyprenyltransferase